MNDTTTAPYQAALSRSDTRDRFWLAVLAATAIAFVYLLLRNHGLMPAVFADEWFYSKYSRLQPLGESALPSYLYLWMFRGSSACGPQFLECVRVGNELFYVAAAPFLYLVARRLCSARLALFIAIVSLLAPFNVYTSFFMPETTYYFGFAVLSWACLVQEGAGWLRRGLAAGIVLGLMSLIKVHAIFLLPSLFLFLLVAPALRGEPGWFAAGLKTAVLASALTMAIKYGLGYLLAGEAALSLYGKFYTAAAANATDGMPMSERLQAMIVNGRGHLLALAVLQGLPLAMLAYAVVDNLASPAARKRAGARVTQHQLFTLLMLGAAVGMTVAYTASIARVGKDEVLRLHLRYYSFMFPLVLMVAAAAIGKRQEHARKWLAWTIAALVGVVLLVALVRLPTYALGPIDGPDIDAINLRKLPGWIIVALGALSLYLWAKGSARAAAVFLFGVVPLTTVAGMVLNTRYLHQIVEPGPYDVAGMAVRDYVPRAEHGDITVLDTGMAYAMRTEFYIDNPHMKEVTIAEDAPLESWQLPIRSKWMLLLGNHKLPEGIKPALQGPAYQLVRMHKRPVGVTAFGKPFEGIVADVEGLSIIEPWGRWSTGKQVVVHFREPLPANAYILMRVRAFGSNTQVPFTARVGDQEQQFRGADETHDVALYFRTDGTQRTMVIDVPHPESPFDKGMSVDKRLLGVGIEEIEVSVRED